MTPQANSRVFGWVQTEKYGSTTGPVQTDASGRYTFSAPSDARIRIHTGSGAFQPCEVSLQAIGHVTQDLHVVVDRQQLGAHLPPALRAQTPTLSGLVFELRDGTRIPVADVRVELDGLYGMGLVTATTLTDADGRYVLCGLRDESSTYLFASKSGYRLFETTVPLSGNTTLDVELAR
jgi:hypothetical protein